MIVRLILIPVALCLAAAGALLALMIGIVANPELAGLWAALAERILDTAAAAAMGDEQGVFQIAMLAAASWKLVLAVIFAPCLIMAVVSEVFGLRSGLVQVIATAVLTAAVPFALLPETLSASGMPSVLLTVLATAGAIAGMVYWLVAGRGAGRGAGRLSGPGSAES
jgi:hypothetical protein